MNYPLISEYIEAIRTAEDNFDELKHLRPVLDEDGEPVMTSGNFAVVFKMKNEQTGKLHAVKCFLKEQEGRAEAYRMIAEELEYVNSTFLTPIKYLDKELFVDSANSEDSEFPVLLMDWVEGQTLDKFIREHIDDEYELALLTYQFSRLAMWLMPQPFAHGDLKPDNILVKEDGTLVLVDYDGMYVPAMKGQKARELGSPDFRHLGRTEEVFDEHIDDFSLASILLSLKAIALQPSLLEEYGTSDRLLFSETDYRNLSESSALGALQSLMQDAELASLYSLYILALSQNNLSQVSFRLFNLSRPDRSQYEDENLSTEVTDEDLANAWTDEYGCKYSADGKRLLKAPIDIKKYTIRKGTKIICDNAFTNIIDVDYRDVKSHCEYPDFVEKVETWGGELEMVSIPRGITKIGKKAFYNCEKLATISVPDGVKLIDNAAFYGCSNLVFISMPDSVSYLGREIFGGCYSLSEIYLPIHLKEIPVRAFAKCKSLKFAVIPHGIKKIGTHAFDGCTSLASIEIPNSVEEITIGAFNRCENLDSVVLHNGLKKIGQSAFESCKSLSELTLPESLEEIGIGAFRWSGLTTIFISKKVTKIGVDAFSGCSNLTSIEVDNDNTCFDSRQDANALIDSFQNKLIFGCASSKLPNDICVIGKNAFYGCKGLFSISIPPTVTVIEDGAYSGCKDLTKVDLKNVVKLGKSSFEGCTSLRFISFSEKLTIISDNSFRGCISLSSLIIPKSVNCIGHSCFWGCKGLKNITILNNDAIIEGWAFSDCSNLEFIRLPEHMQEIQQSTFHGCEKLKNLKIPLKIKRIGDGAFAFCKSLKTLSIPNSVIRIEKYAFSACEDLSIVSLTGNVEVVGDKIFNYCKLLDSIHIPHGTMSKFRALLPEYFDKLVEEDNSETLDTAVTEEDLKNAWTDEYGVKYSADGKRLLKAPKGIEKYSIMEGTKIICDNAFIAEVYHNKTLKSVIIPPTVSSIGKYSFAYNQSLGSIIIPDSVLSIGGEAFYGCHGLVSITLSKRLTKIEDNTFSMCWGLKSLQLPDGLIEIGKNAFSECHFSEITIPDTVVSIENNSFYRCGLLTSIVIPNNISWIGDGAFEGCYNLSSIYVDKKNKLFDSRENCNALIETRSNILLKGCSSTIIPQSIKKIGKYSFYDSIWLTTIVIPENVEEIADNAFEKCSNLMYINIYNPSIHISKNVFSGCNSLVSIYIPVGSKSYFERLLPDYSDKLVENQKEWLVKGIRHFTAEEIETVKDAEVVPSSEEIMDANRLGTALPSMLPTKVSHYRYCVRFRYFGGGYSYIPLSNNSTLSTGSKVNISTAKLITLCCEGEGEIFRVIEQ